MGSGQTVILNKLSEALHCAGDSGDNIAPCLVYMVTKVRRGGRRVTWDVRTINAEGIV